MTTPEKKQRYDEKTHQWVDVPQHSPAEESARPPADDAASVSKAHSPKSKE